MSKIVEILYYYENSSPKEFEVQTSITLDSANYAFNGWQVIKTPTTEGEILEVQLLLKAGNHSEIVHKVPVGTFPNQISNWKLDVVYLDENGAIVKKKGDTEQAEASARPKPLKIASA